MQQAVQRRIIQLLDQARCARGDVPPGVMLSSRPEDHLVARTFCAECPVTRECLDQVQPESGHFDGTAGGLFWLGGRDITKKIADDWLRQLSSRYRHSHVSHVRIRRALLAEISLGELSPSELMVFAYAAAEHGVDRRQICRWLSISSLVLSTIIAAVERDAPADTVRRASTWPMAGGYVRSTSLARPRATSAVRPAG